MLQTACSANGLSVNFEPEPARPKASDPAMWISEPQQQASRTWHSFDHLPLNGLAWERCSRPLERWSSFSPLCAQTRLQVRKTLRC